MRWWPYSVLILTTYALCAVAFRCIFSFSAVYISIDVFILAASYQRPTNCLGDTTPTLLFRVSWFRVLRAASIGVHSTLDCREKGPSSPHHTRTGTYPPCWLDCTQFPPCSCSHNLISFYLFSKRTWFHLALKEVVFTYVAPLAHLCDCLLISIWILPWLHVLYLLLVALCFYVFPSYRYCVGCFGLTILCPIRAWFCSTIMGPLRLNRWGK